MDAMRHVTMQPMVDGPIFELETWDTNRTGYGDKSLLGYRLSCASRIIFEGEDFGCSPLHPIDSDDALRSILGFLTLQPGDIDEEYFEDYTPGQLGFAEEWGEHLSLWAMEEEPYPWDSDLIAY